MTGEGEVGGGGGGGGKRKGREEKVQGKIQSRIQNGKNRDSRNENKKNNVKECKSSREKGFYIGTLWTSQALAYSLGAVKHNRCFPLIGKKSLFF